MPETLKRSLLQEETKSKRLKEDDWGNFQANLETSMRSKCLCRHSNSDLITHLDPVLLQPGSEQCFLLINFLVWLGETFHEELISGAVCARIQNLVNHLIQNQTFLQSLVQHLKDSDDYVKHSACQAVTSLLPLSYCGQDIALDTTEIFIKDVISKLKFTCTENRPNRISLTSNHNSSITANHSSSITANHSSSITANHISSITANHSSSITTNHSSSITANHSISITANHNSSITANHSSSMTDDLSLTDGETAELSLDMLGETGNLGGSFGGESFGDQEESSNQTNLSDTTLDQQAWLLRILCGFVSHGGRQREENISRFNNKADCEQVELEDEMLCQEFQVKCLVLKALEPNWQKLAKTLAKVAEKSAKSDSENPREVKHVTYLTEGFKLWKSLISIRANLNFVDTRSFGAHLSLPLYALQSSSAPCIWRSVLDTVSECLCYGSTLGLQSIPPEEPCQLAHTLIRLVRFEGFLSRVPYKHSSGFGGIAAIGGISGEEDVEEDYDKGLVQKIVLVLLKAVALTTREARVDSSSGESDSSLSSAESGDSCSSDLVIIERNMSGMYKQLDSWIKSVLPLLPESKLQDNILHLLQEQDDVLIEGLLCMLDTHIALHVPGRDNQGLFDTSPTGGFTKLLSIVGGDSSVMLDFLVSNETCFLLYILRFLKFIVKDWSMFMCNCGDSYSSTLGVLLQLKTSINRLMKKDLFPYNIGPVYKLLEKVETLAGIQNEKDHYKM